ncbi:hypothetical protein GS461_20400 [Rhodococcus hoagii]|nr:hypothetical protein [Prescottella equi]
MLTKILTRAAVVCSTVAVSRAERSGQRRRNDLGGSVAARQDVDPRERSSNATSDFRWPIDRVPRMLVW